MEIMEKKSLIHIFNKIIDIIIYIFNKIIDIIIYIFLVLQGQKGLNVFNRGEIFFMKEKKKEKIMGKEQINKESSVGNLNIQGFNRGT